MTKQWTVGKLIALGFGVAIIVTICLNLVSLWQFKQNQKTITMLLQSDLPILSDLSHLGQEVAGLRQNEKNFLLNIGSPQDQQKYLQNFKQIAGTITSKLDTIIKKLSADDDLSPETIKEAKSLEALHQQYIKGFAMHAKMVHDNPAMTPQMANKMMIPLKETVHLIEKRLESLQHSTEEMIQENNTELISATNMTSRLLIAGLAGSILLLLVVGYAIGRKINLVLGAAITSLDGNATRLSTMAAEIAANSQSMADAATNQAASLEETSAAIEEISSQTKANASSSDQADILMRKTGSIVNQAQTSMGDLTTSMDEISSASEETSKIVKTIDDISFQTNLLALNAAVEAARAGEAGAGFAVVADEVRNLAMRAAEAAKETAVMIDETVTKIQLGRELVNRTNAEFSQVSESSKGTGTLVDEIHVASNEQVLGIDQINKTVTQLDEVVQQVAANAEESAGASQEMYDQTNELLSTVQIISQLTGVKAPNP